MRTCHRASRSSAAPQIADLGWRNHGTAVLGEMIAVADGKDCVGISHEARGAVHSAVIDVASSIWRRR